MIGQDIHVSILEFLTYEEILGPCSLISKEWYRLSKSRFLWVPLFTQVKIPELRHLPPILEGVRRDYSLTQVPCLSKCETLIQLGSYELFQELCESAAYVVDLPLTVLQYSSFDNEGQGPERTLEEGLFWSSDGSDSSNANEFISYSLREVSAIWSVEWVNYKANFQIGMPTYGPQFIQITIAMDPGFTNISYTSDLLSTPNINTPFRFELGKACVVIGEYIRIDMIGKNQTQYTDLRYYTCLERVIVEGCEVLSGVPSLRNQCIPTYKDITDSLVFTGHSEGYSLLKQGTILPVIQKLQLNRMSHCARRHYFDMALNVSRGVLHSYLELLNWSIMKCLPGFS